MSSAGRAPKCAVNELNRGSGKWLAIEQLRNSRGDARRIGGSYLCCSNCDGIKHDALTVAEVDQ